MGAATATTVGAVVAPADAKADLALENVGISQNGQAINIGDTGNVMGNAFSSGIAMAQTTNGSATATGVISARGVTLQTTAADITIGGAGNVTGLAVLGALNSSGNLADQIQVAAAAVLEDATSISTFNGEGIRGVDTKEATITAGARDGDISG